jgi:hypothetical protein
MIDTPNLMESYNHCFPQVKTPMTPLSKALARGDGQTAQELMQGEYNLQERWQITVFKNLDFNDTDFLLLSPEMQSLIYRTANNFNNISLVARLNTLGKYTTDAPITKPCILSLRMDIATTHQTISAYLKKLRQENRLLTETEFQNFQSNGSWFKKGNFTRILGRDYILDLTKELNLKHIKVPEKKVVIHSNKEKLSFEIGQYESRDIVWMKTEDISIYAQEIQKVNRFVSREEMTELFTIIKAANFSDLWYLNFIVAEDGIYFIDTEIKSFVNRICWDKMKGLASFMAKEDQEWFKGQIYQKIEDLKHAKPEDFLDFSFAHQYGKGAKKIAQATLAKGIIDTAAIVFAVECQQIIKQYKLVGSYRFCNRGMLLIVDNHVGKPFSFSVQDLLKRGKVDFKSESDISSSTLLAQFQ